MAIRFKKNYFINAIVFFTFIIFTLCILIYLPCDIYNFQPPQKFSGSYLYNPYKNSTADWQKSNFHAHAIAWKGITNGKQPAQTILNAYKVKGYNYACISNYENVAKEDVQANAVDAYEHGYNIRKVHQLIIMPKKVCYADFPLWQFASAKQFSINKLSVSAKAVVIAHPLVQKGYSDEDLKKLSGYNLMEVLNHAGNSSDKWDVALSAGKPVWIIGDDDTHNIFDSTQTFKNWTMINCVKHNKDSLVQNLINGDAYAVNGSNAFNDNKLMNVKINGMQVSIQLQSNADSIKFIGQNGTTKKVYLNVNSGDYTFLDNDTYIRAVVYNKASAMYLNPVMRFDGKTKPQNILTATINPAETILYRSFLIVGWMVVLIYFYQNSLKYILRWLKTWLPLKRKLPRFSLEID